jgi:hypothetical protein
MDFSTLITAADPTLDPASAELASLLPMLVVLALLVICVVAVASWRGEAS